MANRGKSLIKAIDEALEKGLLDVPLPPDVAGIRKRLGLTQSEFSEAYAINLEVLKKWEQHKRFPDTTAQAYLRCIEKAPDTIATLING